MKAGERVLVIGSGMGGLATALALDGSGAEVTLIERDPEPPAITPAQAFDEWPRAGVPQFRHAHIFLARMQTTLRDQHPKLLEELLAAGVKLSEVEQILPAAQVAGYVPEPDDRDLLHLWGRRATIELVIRRHVERLPHVRFVHGTRVEGLIVEKQANACVVRGLRVVKDGAHESLEAELVIDASGKHTKSPEWLAEHGVKVESSATPSSFVYVCRHYRLKDATQEPPRRGTGANLDYLWYGTFYAEHGHFAIAFACPTEEQELARALRTVEGFDAICKELPVLALWTGLAEPTSKVVGAGGFQNRWMRYGTEGGAELLGFLPVGDSLVETNPMYGRGCSSAFVQGRALREALDSTDDPRERARRYHAITREQLSTHFDFCLTTDRMSQSRAKLERKESIALPDRALSYLFDAAFVPAMNKSTLVAREMLKAMQMRQISSLSVRLRMVAAILLAWCTSLLGMRAKEAPLGPPRTELLARIAAQRSSLRVEES